jgi:hypothetical protein
MSDAIYHQRNQSIQVTDGMTVMSLSASLLQKIKVAMDHLCQITLNQKLLRKFEKWYKFSSRIKVKLHKNKLCETRPACTFLIILYIYVMILLCINTLPFIFNNLYDMPYMSATLVDPWVRLQFAAKTCRSIKNQLCNYLGINLCADLKYL